MIRPFLTWTPVGLCCIAAVIPHPSKWLLIGIIGPALLIMAVNWVWLQFDLRDFREAADLNDKWVRQRRRRCGQSTRIVD